MLARRRFDELNNLRLFYRDIPKESEGLMSFIETTETKAGFGYGLSKNSKKDKIARCKNSEATLCQARSLLSYRYSKILSVSSAKEKVK